MAADANGTQPLRPGRDRLAPAAIAVRLGQVQDVHLANHRPGPATGVGAIVVLTGVWGNGMEAKVMPGDGCQVVSITYEVPAHPVLYISERRAAPEPAGAVARWPRFAVDRVHLHHGSEIGRASCRDRGCQYV